MEWARVTVVFPGPITVGLSADCRTHRLPAGGLQFEGRAAMRFVRVISVCMALAATAGARRSAAKDGAWITFLSHRTGENVLYRMHPDGSDLQPMFGGELKDPPGLPGGMKWYRQPHWSRQSPDGAYFPRGRSTWASR